MRLILLLRAGVVTAGGQLLVSTGAIAAVAAFLRDALLRRRSRPLTLLGATAAPGYQFAAKPWMRSWGATPAETARALPGDDLVPDPSIQVTQAVTIFEPGRVIGLEGWGIFLVEPAGAETTRLIARGRISGWLFFLGYEALPDIPHFVMQREMLLEIKARAEAGSLPLPVNA